MSKRVETDKNLRYILNISFSLEILNLYCLHSVIYINISILGIKFKYFGEFFSLLISLINKQKKDKENIFKIFNLDKRNNKRIDKKC